MKDLMKLKLKKNEDPDSIADEIAGIEAKFSVTIDEEQKSGRGIKCYYCGVFGHRANECPQKKKDIANGTYQSNSKLECSHCGGKGHTAEFCWDKEENKHKRPSNWKPKSSENAITHTWFESAAHNSNSSLLL